jgi:hypothetical protein
MANLPDAVKAYRAAEAGIDTAKRQAAERIRAAREKADQKRTELHEAIVGAALAGMAQVEIIRITGYSRERVRMILRAGGVEAEN